MRGAFEDQGRLFSYISPEQRIPGQHPLRTIRELVREVLSELDRDFRKLYSTTGRPSIPPEQVLSALLLQVCYGGRSERQRMEQLDYNLLYRWFVGRAPDDAVWDATTFTKNRERLQHGDMFNRFMETLFHHKEVMPLLSDEHFSVDGTRIEAWAGHKSFKPKNDQDGDGEHFHGTTRKTVTHASTPDPDCRLYRKSDGKDSNLCSMGHATMENRNGLAVAGLVTQASGPAERAASEELLVKKASPPARITVGADKASDVEAHIEHLRAKNITPHIAVNTYVTKTGMVRKTSIDGRTTRHKGYSLSQRNRKMIECVFGGGKQHGTMRKTKHKGVAAVATNFLLNLIGYTLIRIPKLLAQRG
jgi:transposase